MMVGMMAPSAAPMILMYARLGRQGKVAGQPLAATGWFAAGYFLAWIGFFPGGNAGPMGVATRGPARSPHGKRQ
jgi:predicted metal-binding membrane protein